jgi:sigma-E factor negative regulatory protein RseB
MGRRTHPGTGHRLIIGVLALVGAVAMMASAATAEEVVDDPATVLSRMALAVERLEYEGTLVYLYGHHLTTLRITHRFDGGESRESLLALNGPIRAVARNDRGVICVLPGTHPITVERAPPGNGMLRSTPLDPVLLEPHYLIHPLGHSRVAGRDTDVIGIIPRDNLRYGYRFYVDQATGLPLKTDLMDRSATPIEQVMFTDLTVMGMAESPQTAASRQTQDNDETEASFPSNESVDGESGTGESVDETDAADAGWHFAALPPGFRVVAHERRDGAPEHFLLSDGLASVSVYIEADSGAGLRGATRMGAVHAAGRMLDDRQVTVVGQVPADTIAHILSTIRPAR